MHSKKHSEETRSATYLINGKMLNFEREFVELAVLQVIESDLEIRCMFLHCTDAHMVICSVH